MGEGKNTDYDTFMLEHLSNIFLDEEIDESEILSDEVLGDYDLERYYED